MDLTVVQDQLPSEIPEGFPLPSPHEVRRKARDDGLRQPETASRPDPVRFAHLGLIVKWGSYVTIAEGQCLWYLNQHLRSEIPVPRILGWKRDGGQTFLYLELVAGDSLLERWPTLDEDNKRLVCDQLHFILAKLRSLRRDDYNTSLCQIGGQPLCDTVFESGGLYPAGPFDSVSSFHDALATFVYPIDQAGSVSRERIPQLAGLSDDVALRFTHGDLDQSNILISKPDDGSIRIVALIDWHQSGWYPEPWEWLKAQATAVPESGWKPEDLSSVLPPAEFAYYYAFEYISMTVI